MLTPEETAYLERIAWEATKGIVGAENAQPGGELYEGIVRGLEAVADAAHARGLKSTMVQLSLVHDGAHVVG